MSEDASARLGLPYLAAGQLQKHVTLNEALTRLDALVQSAVVSRTTAEAPAEPAEGALYILPPGASGVGWAGRAAGALMRAELGGWIEVSAPDGMLAAVLDAGELVVKRDGGWSEIGGGGAAPTELQNLARLGVNTTADETNRVAAKVNKVLWTALGLDEDGDGDLRFTFNKQAAGNVLSLLFQSGWGGRAELGLIGDDDLRMKVSPDGGTWHEALSVDRNTGRVSFPLSTLRREVTTLTESGTYAPPAWACWIEATAVGGGGGGGAGEAGPAGLRHGGAGGEAGGQVRQTWSAGLLAEGLSVRVGRGGAGAGGAAQAGADGGDTVVALGGTVLLRAPGGAGGRGGLEGASSLRQVRADPERPGDGGAGGGLEADGGARAALSGGSGGVMAGTDLSPAGGGGAGGAADANGAGRDGDPGAGHGAGGGGGGAGLTRPGQGGAGGCGAVVFTAVG